MSDYQVLSNKRFFVSVKVPFKFIFCNKEKRHKIALLKLRKINLDFFTTNLLSKKNLKAKYLNKKWHIYLHQSLYQKDIQTK